MKTVDESVLGPDTETPSYLQSLQHSGENVSVLLCEWMLDVKSVECLGKTLMLDSKPF